MYIVELTYKVQPERINELLEAHRDYLRRYYAKGNFLVSGPQNPRTGGVIVARADSREALQRILDEDPFKQAGAAEYRVLQFDVAFSADILKTWL